jgi:hypothetical protein
MSGATGSDEGRHRQPHNPSKISKKGRLYYADRPFFRPYYKFDNYRQPPRSGGVRHGVGETVVVDVPVGTGVLVGTVGLGVGEAPGAVAVGFPPTVAVLLGGGG